MEKDAAFARGVPGKLALETHCAEAAKEDKSRMTSNDLNFIIRAFGHSKLEVIFLFHQKFTQNAGFA